MHFTLVSTVFNESKRLGESIRDLEAQTLQPSEIIITDAGSTDGTYEKLLQWKAESDIPISIFQKAKCNVAVGRNLAIHAAKNDIIVSTDFGCCFHPYWLESIMTPFSDPDVNAVGGAYTVKESEIKTLPAKAAYILSDGYNVDVNAPWFIPSSRSIAYKKKVFYTVGGYPEWLTLAGDDMVFGKEILAKGYSFYLVDKPYVFWGRHTTAKGYIREANRYGLGDGEARLAFKKFVFKSAELIVRYVSFVVLLASILFPQYFRTWEITICLILFILSLRSWAYFFKNWLKFRSSKYNGKVLLYSFYFFDATRVNYIRGYVKGYFSSPKAKKKQAIALSKRLLATE